MVPLRSCPEFVASSTCPSLWATTPLPENPVHRTSTSLRVGIVGNNHNLAPAQIPSPIFRDYVTCTYLSGTFAHNTTFSSGKPFQGTCLLTPLWTRFPASMCPVTLGYSYITLRHRNAPWRLEEVDWLGGEAPWEPGKTGGRIKYKTRQWKED